MTRKELWEKRNWFLFLIGYFVIGYLPLNWFNESRSYYYTVAFPFERDLPFIPAFILGYLVVYGSIVILYFLVDTIGLWRRAVVAHLILMTVCYVVFFAFPVRMIERPAVDDIVVRSLIDVFARTYFIIDRPYNLMPSLHAAFPMLGTLLVWHRRPVGRYVLMTTTIITCVSVVLVKQHYIMDVVVGLAAAALAYVTARKTERIWLPWFEEKSG